MRVNLKHRAPLLSGLTAAHSAEDIELFDKRNVKLDTSDVMGVTINAEAGEVATVTVVYQLTGLGDAK